MTENIPQKNTGWIEATGRFSDRLHLTLGEYYGQQEGSASFSQPKVVAVYRPDNATWVSAMAIPIFRNDVAELSPVEALSDPAGLGSSWRVVAADRMSCASSARWADRPT